jgi:pyruvate formate lyase activating enzyme
LLNTDAVGLVFDIDKFAVHDGPGIRTAVFLKGCPLHCTWCHSPESQANRIQLLYSRSRCTACGDCLEVCPERALKLVAGAAEVDRSRCSQSGACAETCYPGAFRLSGEWRSVEQVFGEIEKDQPFFVRSGGGVTLTGGEVTQQSAFAHALLSRCHAARIHTAIETCGLAPWRVFERLCEVTDLFLYDVKHMDEAAHRRHTGASNGSILFNLQQLAAGRAKGGYDVIVRVPCIPGINDDDQNISATATFMLGVGLDTIHLLPYNESAGAKYEWLGRPYALAGTAAQSAARMQHLAELCASRGLAVQIGG